MFWYTALQVPIWHVTARCPKGARKYYGFLPLACGRQDGFQATLDAQVFGETVELTRETCRKSFRVETYHIKTILAATRKLTLGRSDSDYKSNFTLMRKLYLTQLKKDIVLKEAITESVACYLNAEAEQNGKRASPTGVRSGKAKRTKKAKPIKMRWFVNKTKVATTSGDNGRFPDLAPTTSGWVDGILVAIDDTFGVELPYKIQSFSSPQVYSFVSETAMVELYDTWLECEDKVLCTQWLTGREMLWLYERKGVEEPQIRYATAMYYDRLLDKYKLLSRDGSEVFVTAAEFDSANDNNDHYTDEERSLANEQPWTDRTAAKIASYGCYCARNIIPKEVVTNPIPKEIVSTTEVTAADCKRGHRGDVTKGPEAVVASGSKSRPLTNALVAGPPINGKCQDDADVFSSVTQLGNSVPTTNKNLVVRGAIDHSTEAVDGALETKTSLLSTA